MSSPLSNSIQMDPLKLTQSELENIQFEDHVPPMQEEVKKVAATVDAVANSAIGAAANQGAPDSGNLLLNLSSADFFKDRVIGKNDGLLQAIAKLKIDGTNVRGLKNLPQIKTNLEAYINEMVQFLGGDDNDSLMEELGKVEVLLNSVKQYIPTNRPLKSSFILVLNDMIGKLAKLILGSSVKASNPINGEAVLTLLATKDLREINIIGRKNGLHDESGKEYWSHLSLERKMVRGATQLAKSFESVDVKGIDVNSALAKLEKLRSRMCFNAETKKGREAIAEEMSKAMDNLRARKVAVKPAPTQALQVTNPVQKQAELDLTDMTTVLTDYVVAPIARNIWPVAKTALMAGLFSLI